MSLETAIIEDLKASGQYTIRPPIRSKSSPLSRIGKSLPKPRIYHDMRRVRKIVYKIQCAIFKLSKENNIEAMHALQDRLIRSRAARIIAVKRVAADSSGKNTAGIDGVKKLSPKQQTLMAKNLRIPIFARPVRRVWIPKPGTNEKRPLGIPTILDRATQALVLLALEPEWEAKFDIHSYGFRTGRSAHDAVKYIDTALRHATKWIHDGDLSKCFDSINHKALLDKLTQLPGSNIHEQISSWLKAGIFEKGSPFITPERGTPQGGVISPLLANIALNGLEDACKACVKSKENKKSIRVVRYADDYIIMTPEKKTLEFAVEAAKKHFESVGLSINKSKTRTLHSLEKSLCPDQDTRFKFLGFLFHQRKVGKRNAVKAAGGMRVLWKVAILPHPKNVSKLFDKIRTQIRLCTTPEQVIRRLNPIIRGWCNYFRVRDASTEHKVAAYGKRLYLIISNWQKRQYHTRKRLPSIWKTVGTNNWVFYSGKFTLANFGCVSWSINTYVSIKAEKSPYDGDTAYWLERNNKQRKLVTALLRKQRHKCSICKMDFDINEPLQIDHIIARALGGSEKLVNLQLLHVACHVKKTTSDRSLIRLQKGK